MFDFFTACTDVNENIARKCFLKKDETLWNFKPLAKELIHKLYINKNTCGSP